MLRKVCLVPLKKSCFKENVAGCCSHCEDHYTLFTIVNVIITFLYTINGISSVRLVIYVVCTSHNNDRINRQSVLSLCTIFHRWLFVFPYKNHVKNKNGNYSKIQNGSLSGTEDVTFHEQFYKGEWGINFSLYFLRPLPSRINQTIPHLSWTPQHAAIKLTNRIHSWTRFQSQKLVNQISTISE